ncbi:MAG TPA: L-threonylcarbamoyladenylate synthase [Candidatus Norongarragalinales archaeon]|nr:L-threonylcarbamoyladenylate synthase [Candidatus Norongarragalinales archaeon]
MSARIISENDPTALSDVVYVLANGGIVVSPTETCYGILADATNPTAVEKLYKIKGRSHSKAISIFVPDERTLYGIAATSQAAKKLVKKHLPGPLTLILEQRKPTILAKNLTDGKTIAVRISSHPFISGVLFNYNKPVTATSANHSGKGEIYSGSEAVRLLGKLTDIIVDGGNLKKARPSTIVDCTGTRPQIVRQGSIRLKL